jgi:hypothetical protein
MTGSNNCKFMEQKLRVPPLIKKFCKGLRNQNVNSRVHRGAPTYPYPQTNHNLDIKEKWSYNYIQ